MPRPSDAPRSSRGYRVLYRETHTFLEELAEATLAETRKEYLAELARAHLLIIDDLGMRKLPHTAAEDLLELIMRRYERASTMLTAVKTVGRCTRTMTEEQRRAVAERMRKYWAARRAEKAERN